MALIKLVAISLSLQETLLSPEARTLRSGGKNESTVDLQEPEGSYSVSGRHKELT